MQLDDLVVEVRDRDLVRRHQIDAQFLGGSVFSPRPNGVGTWQVTLPAEVDGELHEAAAVLREKGSGIIVTGPHGVIMSGPTVEPEGEADAEAPEGTWTFSGVSDAILLSDALAVPDPASLDPHKQAFANDVRTGPVETLLRQYVAFNIANGDIGKVPVRIWAPPYRLRGFRKLFRLGDPVDLRRGPVRSKSPRYTNLLELCQDIVAGTDFLFDVRQVDGYLEFVVWEAEDLTASHRMDIENDQLTSTRYSYSVPDLTEAYVAGQGEGTDRTVLVRTSAAAAAEEAAWGRPIERFIDQRQTDDRAELEQKVDATLADALASIDSLTVVPSDDLASDYGRGWTAGARVTVVVGEKEVPARINQAVIAVTGEGVMLGCVIGDSDGDFEARTNRSISGLTSRVSSLERNGTGKTDWLPLTVLSPWTQSSTIPLQIQVTPYRVELSGSVLGASTGGAFRTVALIPDNMPRPRAQVRTPLRQDATVHVAVTNDGQIQLATSAAVTGGIGIALDGIGFAY